MEELRRQFLERLKAVKTKEELEALRVEFLGKKGHLKSLLSRIKELPPEERREFGRQVNELKEEIEGLIAQKARELAEQPRPTDLTRPGWPFLLGNVHPIRRVFDELIEAAVSMGFQVELGPEVEWDWYNFEALNIPKYHPARDMQATMFITERMVLRTHTSPIQIRVMERRKPPIRIVGPGKVYRLDPFDASHAPAFHQLEALYVDKGVSFAQLRSDIYLFLKRVFGEDIEIKFIPSYFPFTEPSAEVAVRWRGQWLEILGCGMVHPQVLKNTGIDPEEYTGYAFGMGVERIAMVKYGIDDIRLFWENDREFLEQMR